MQPRTDSNSQPATEEASGRGFAALRVPDFRLFLAGSAFSRIGDNMESVTRSWLVWQLTGSPFWLGVMVFFHWFPNTVLSMYAGVLADRVDNRKLVLGAESLYMLSSLLMGVLTVIEAINIWEIAFLLLLHGVSGAISNPSRQVLVHDLVGKDKLMSGVSLVNSLFQCMTFVGPALAGTLIYAYGPGPTYLLTCLAFLPALLTLSLIRVEKQHRQSGQVSAWQSFGEGLRHVRENPVLMSLLIMTTVPALFVADSLSAMMPIFATQVLDVGAQGMGFLLSANGLGAIMAALSISYLGNLRHKGQLIIATSVLYGVLLIAFSLSSTYVVSLLVLVAAGAASVASNTFVATSLQLAATDSLRGRVMGLYSLGTLGVRSFNGPMIGTFASALGAPLALGFMGGLVAIAVLATAVLSRLGRALD